MISLSEPASVQIRRGELGFPAASKIKGNSGFVSGQRLFGSLVPYRIPIVTLRCRSSLLSGCSGKTSAGLSHFLNARSTQKQTAHLLSQMGGRIAIRHHGGITPAAECLSRG
jgi:hypothetical protein